MYDRAFAESILDNCAPIPFCGCWVWLGRENRNGYGRKWHPGLKKEVMTHIATFRGLIGEYDPSLILDHTCRTRLCCWPWHLEPVTHQINTLRGEAILFKPMILLPALVSIC